MSRPILFIKSLFITLALLVGNGVWGQYSGTGTFSKITSLNDLTNGYYVIVNSGDGFAMNNSNAGSYFTHTTVTPVTGKITNPTNTIVWKIETHIDGGFTIFNEQSSKYVSYTGSGNDAFAVSTVSSANQRWNITYASNVFSFANAALTTRILQYNSGSPRFACYTSSQQKIILYKIDAASSNAVSTPTISASGSLNTTDNYFNTASITLSSATDGASIYYTTNGDTPTASSTLYSAPFDITSTTTIKAIAIKSGMDNSDVASKTISITAVSAPTITITEISVPEMTAVTGLSDSEILNVSGAVLTANIAVSITGTNAAMFSVSPEAVSQSGGIASGSVTVTYNPTAPGTHTATLRFNSTGATEVTRTLNGTSAMATPIATNATGISTSGFTANWNAVTGASEYELNVYTKTSGGSTTQTENFNGITPSGNLIGTATYLSGWSVSSQSTSRQIYTSSGNFGLLAPSLAFTTTGDFIETATYALPIQEFSFWAKQQTGATSSTLIEGYNGSTWSTIATLSNADVATSGTKTYDLISLGKTNVVKIKMSFTKDAGNLSIDDISVTYGGSANPPIAGSPFTVTGSTTKAITGLAENTTYYYKVIAKSGSIATAASNETTVITTNSTDINNVTQNLQLRTINGNIVFNASGGLQVTVYNSVGQRVSNQMTIEGNNTIPARIRGVVFVKIGSEISKLIVE